MQRVPPTAQVEYDAVQAGPGAVKPTISWMSILRLQEAPGLCTQEMLIEADPRGIVTNTQQFVAFRLLNPKDATPFQPICTPGGWQGTDGSQPGSKSLMWRVGRLLCVCPTHLSMLHTHHKYNLIPPGLFQENGVSSSYKPWRVKGLIQTAVMEASAIVCNFPLQRRGGKGPDSVGN